AAEQADGIGERAWIVVAERRRFHREKQRKRRERERDGEETEYKGWPPPGNRRPKRVPQESRMRPRVAAVSMLALALCGAAAWADPVEDFYRGRTVTLVIGYSVAGGYDTYARVVAHHLGKHIPASPTLVP